MIQLEQRPPPRRRSKGARELTAASSSETASRDSPRRRVASRSEEDRAAGEKIVGIRLLVVFPAWRRMSRSLSRLYKGNEIFFLRDEKPGRIMKGVYY